MSAFAAVELSLLQLGAAIEAATEVPMAYPNARFTPPSQMDRTSAWMRLSIQHTDRGDLHALHRQTLAGTLIISVFVPIDTGSARLAELTDAVVALIEAGDAGACVFRRTYTQEGSQLNAAAGWLQRNVLSSFTADEVLA